MLKGFFTLWMSMLFLSVVDGEGAGMDEDDFLIDDPEPTPPKKEKSDPEPVAKAEEESPKTATLDEATQKKLDALEADKEARDISDAISAAVADIQTEYPDFDIEKISTFLQEMHKENPSKAEAYNTPAGWEAVWLKNFASREEEGTFDPGRNNSEEPFDFEKTKKEALNGNKRAKAALFDNAK